VNINVVAQPDLIANIGLEINGFKLNSIFENVCDLDLTSLYPSIILAMMIEPGNQLGKITLHDETQKDDKGKPLEMGEYIASSIHAGDYIKFCEQWMGLPGKDELIKQILSE